MSKFEKFYDKNYKKFLILPALLILISVIYLISFYAQNGDIINRDVTLSGGTTITFSSEMSAAELESQLSQSFEDVSVSALSDNTGKQLSLVVTVANQEPEEVQSQIESITNTPLTNENSSIEFTGSSLGADFYNQLVRAVIFAFLLMASVVFIVFGESKKIKVYTITITLAAAKLTFPQSNILNILVFILAFTTFIYSLILSESGKEYAYSLLAFVFFSIAFFVPSYLLIVPLFLILITIYTIVSVPSIAVIVSAFADILIPLAIINAVGMNVSSAGIVAFLMLVGYSVDTDILLTTRVLKRKKDSINSAIYGAFKTGTTMTLTSIVAVAVALSIVYNFGSILNQIFTILLIGLSVDLLNTWITNASLIKWYSEKRKK